MTTPNNPNLSAPSGSCDEGVVERVAAKLEEWDMKPPPNACSGHDYKDIARDLLTVIPQAEACSFCPAFAATQVSDDNDILPACQRCADAWALDPGFASNAALSTSSSTLTPDADELCSDCPPVGYPTDKTRCLPCPRRATPAIRDQAFEKAAKVERALRHARTFIENRTSQLAPEHRAVVARLNEGLDAIRALKGTPPSPIEDVGHE